MKIRGKVVLSAIGALFLGILGSALWSYLFEPAFGWVGRFLLTIVTLGIESQKTEIYIAVSLGHREAAGLELLLLAAGLFWCGASGFAGYILADFTSERKRRKMTETYSNIANDIYNVTEEEYVANSNEIHKVKKKLHIDELRAERTSSWARWGTLISLLAFRSFFGVRYLSISYTNFAITDFQHNFAICKPYLDAQSEERILSQFAQIRKQEDYVAVMDELSQIGAANGVAVPKVAVW